MATKTKSKKSMKVETPYPKEHKKDDVNFIGNELVKLTDRVNELELSFNDLNMRLDRVAGRMGL